MATTTKSPVMKSSLKDNLDRSIPQIKSPLVLDLFAGGGGLSEGFLNVGCEMVGYIESDKSSCETLITRNMYYALNKRNKLKDYRDYVIGKVSKQELINKFELHREKDSVLCAAISENNYKDLIESVKYRLNNRQLDFIIGGPPCQAYSHIGRARDKQNMKDDMRNYLYKYYVAFLKELKPKIFIFENVPGLITADKGKHLKDMRQAMQEAGYSTDFRLLNTADFGVPQNRKRIILVGWHKRSSMQSYPEFETIERSYTVADFMVDLPEISAGDQIMFKKYVQPNRLLIDLGIIDLKFNVLFDHITRANNQRDLAIYRHAVISKNNGQNLRYHELPKHLITHKNTTCFLDRFKVVDQKSQGSHTIVAHISKDGHYYIHPDIKQNRSLSVREAARLQTFPDNYKFEGSRSSRFKQIGNAVPPMFSKIIAKKLCGYI